jgi:hypothetical protein
MLEAKLYLEFSFVFAKNVENVESMVGMQCFAVVQVSQTFDDGGALIGDNYTRRGFHDLREFFEDSSMTLFTLIICENGVSLRADERPMKQPRRYSAPVSGLVIEKVYE